jgi:hypothetical protein
LAAGALTAIGPAGPVAVGRRAGRGPGLTLGRADRGGGEARALVCRDPVRTRPALVARHPLGMRASAHALTSFAGPTRI